MSPPGSAWADARLVYRPQAQAWPPPPPRRPARPPALGPSVALTRSSRGRAGPWSAKAAAATAPGEGAGRGSPRRLPARSGRGRGRRRGGAGLRPGPRLSAPSRLRSSGRWSGRRRAGPGGGGGRAEDSSLSRPTCLAPPPPPLPNHPFRRCSRPSTRSCGPGRRRDHCSLAPARAPAPSAAAALSASPRRRAHEGAVRPLPDSSVRPAQRARRPLQLRRGGAAAETRMSLGRNCGEGQQAGEGQPQMTSLPYPATLAAAPSAQGRGRREHPNPGSEPGLELLCPRLGGWTGCVIVRSPGLRELLQTRQSVERGLGSSP